MAKIRIRGLENLINFTCHPLRYLASWRQDNELRRFPIYCVMCGYNEHENVEKAIESVIGKADVLVFIDKNGSLQDQVEGFAHRIPIQYHVKHRLNLIESRMFAIEQIPHDAWIMLVDADEVVVVNEYYLHNLLDRRACYRTEKYVRHSAFKELYAMNDYHPFLMPNDEGVYFKPNRDLPRYAGRYINLYTVCIENRAWCKNKRHQYYRTNYWRAWQASPYKGRPIEEYILAVEGEIPDDKTVEEWYEWIISKGVQTR